MRPSCAIVGAGLTGLVAAYRLAQAGWQVEVFERWPAPGGLVAMFEVGGEPLECFYHHLFTTDTDYVELAEELGLGSTIEWLPSRMGMYCRGRLWDFGTPASLLRFRPLPWPAKLRFALTTLYLRHRDNLAEFERVTAAEWIRRWAGRAVWERVWGPLLEQKFADRATTVSMAWLWRKVYLRGRSRSASGLGERLGYMRGGFGQLVDALAGRLGELGVTLHLASPVRRLAPAAGGIRLTVRRQEFDFPLVLFTGSPEELLQVAGPTLPDDYRRLLAPLEGTAALCMVLELSRSLTPYYWLNIADAAFPFGGVIEHTNYIPAQRYGGRVIVYLSKYLFPGAPAWTMRDSELWALYRPFLQLLNPAFDDSWVLARHVFRAAYAQPVVPPMYSRVIPPFATPWPGLYHCCMAQIYPEDRGQNYAVRAGQQAARRLLAALP
ncbi:MAG: NAD(P)/FAD-dependent oxidoreductase [Acidobacteriota bacterium]|jgi:protoporphyrinogen oxidase